MVHFEKFLDYFQDPEYGTVYADINPHHIHEAHILPPPMQPTEYSTVNFSRAHGHKEEDSDSDWNAEMLKENYWMLWMK